MSDVSDIRDVNWAQPPAGNEPTVEVTRLNNIIWAWERRLRLTQSVIWLPRGVFGGLILVLMLAIVARLRPWLLPVQIAELGASLTLIAGATTLLAVWVLPRATLRSAQE